MVALPALAQPRKTLTRAQLATLRKFEQFGPAAAVRGGFLLGGHYYRLATVRPLQQLNLVAETVRYGKRQLGLTANGRTALLLLKPAAGDNARPAPLNPWWDRD